MTSTNPLSPEHLQALTDARIRSKKIRRAAGVATLSGWSLAIFAAFSAAFALTGDWLSIVTAIGLGVCAFNELRGSSMLKHFNPRGPTLLCFNQLGLTVFIIAYSAISLYQSTRPSALKALNASGSPEVDQMMSSIVTPLTYGLYGGLAIIGGGTTLLTAWYYFTRKRLIKVMLSQTPDWIIQTLRAAG